MGGLLPQEIISVFAKCIFKHGISPKSAVTISCGCFCKVKNKSSKFLCGQIYVCLSNLFQTLLVFKNMFIYSVMFIQIKQVNKWKICINIITVYFELTII